MSAQFDQIEHMDWAGPVGGAEGGEGLFGRVDGAGHAASFSAGDPQNGRQAYEVYNDTRQGQTKTRGLAGHRRPEIRDAGKRCRRSIGAHRVITENSAEIARREACISNRRRDSGGGAFESDSGRPGSAGSVVEEDHIGHLTGEDIVSDVRLPRDRLGGGD